MFHFLQQENAELKRKYDDLFNLVKEILEAVKHEENQRVDKRKKKTQTRCKFANRGFCKEGTLCDYLHPQEDCQEHCLTGACVHERTCRQRHPNKCNFWSKGNCFRGNNCVYLHNTEDFNTNPDENHEVMTENNEAENSDDNCDEHEMSSRSISVASETDSKVVDTNEENIETTTEEILAMYESETEDEMRSRKLQKSTKKKKPKPNHS